MATRTMIEAAGREEKPLLLKAGFLSSPILDGAYANGKPAGSAGRPPDARFWNGRALSPREQQIVAAALTEMRAENRDMLAGVMGSGQ